MKTWLIFDCNYLCHRAKYAMGGLSFNGSATGVIYGFLKDIFYFQKYFQTRNIVFCWDYGKGLRENINQEYKRNRREKTYTDEELAFELEFRQQTKKLRKEYLSEIGFKNIFYQKGYEADDIIASVCLNSIGEDEAIIISADHDLYQLLSKKVSVYHPQRDVLMTRKKFKKLYKISPIKWHEVKALSGCSSDNVKGIKGIGEKTAIRYFLSDLKESSLAYKKIESSIEKIYRTNLPLVKLPFSGTNIFKLQSDELSKSGWNNVSKTLGTNVPLPPSKIS